jgi:hypothetical protein
MCAQFQAWFRPKDSANKNDIHNILQKLIQFNNKVKKNYDEIRLHINMIKELTYTPKEYYNNNIPNNIPIKQFLCIDEYYVVGF